MQFEIPFNSKKEDPKTNSKDEKSITSELDPRILDELYKDDHLDQYQSGKKD